VTAARRVQARDPLRVTVEALLFVAVPLLLLAVFTAAVSRDAYAWDFHAFWHGAGAVAHGRDPYSSPGTSPSGKPYDLYMYPPLLAELLVPLGLLPYLAAAVIFVVASALAIPLALRLLGVRDWRCYGAAFLWFPVLHGLRLGALTPFLVLAVAACWRLRNPVQRAGALAVATVFKLFLWPLLVWEAGRAGVRSAVRAAAAAVLLAAVSWATVGFTGLGSYPSLLRSAESHWEEDGYGFGAVARHAGLSASATGLLLLACGVAGSALVLAAMRRGRVDDRGGLALLVGVACAFSPAAWPHYWALLLVPVALYAPRLGPAWFLPLALWASPYEESNGTLWRVGLGLLVLWATIGACLWSGRRERSGATSPRRHAASPLAAALGAWKVP
jgi:Glycosyltransferase family 87